MLGLVFPVSVVVYFFYLQIDGFKRKKYFFENAISSVVIKSSSFYGRGQEFHLHNDVRLFFLPPIGDKIMIGDSIDKDANTYIYKVFRKDTNGEYRFWTTHSFIRLY